MYVSPIGNHVMVKEYIKGLKNAYINANEKELWEHFEAIKHGASKEALKALKEVYQDVPDELIDLLKYVDGTYWRRYKDEEIAFYFLGADLCEYPYYLLSTHEIIEHKNDAVKYYADYIEREYEGVAIDDKIIDKVAQLDWLHFSDCMNNGGTSQLFIDFSPSEKGKKGQIVRFLHDPDEFKVIADSFASYLKKLMEHDYDFISEGL
ncbi:SMI1/KNR4 family protein [Tenacibaculum maritimum]|uniref:SMI1/KNR4 family protein n=1 Tax=Tenacibaculum maritimum TaxID=107401 RepID=UPI00388E98F4